MNEPMKTFRSAELSLWQSAIHHAVSEQEAGAMGVLSSAHPLMKQFVDAAEAIRRGQGAVLRETGGIITQCAKTAAEYAWAEMTGNRSRADELRGELQMSTCDPGWIQSLAAFIEFKEAQGTIPYIRYQHMNDFVIPLADDAVIGIIADWGTGADDAAWLLSRVMEHRPDIIIHLGDIYYSATMDEVKRNFLDVVRREAPGVPVYTLSGNHDMYSGGSGYYWLLQQLGQPASYFCLRSNHWQLLGMDTGLHDADPFTVSSNLTYIDPAEADWHLDKICGAGQRRTILLSHHQLFSAQGIGRSGQGQEYAFNPHLYREFGGVLPQIALWLWGHEHNLCIYEPYLRLPAGRCLGASAIPVMAEQEPYTPDANLDLLGQSAPPVVNTGAARLDVNRDGFYYHAYGILKLQGAAGHMEYYQVNSAESQPAKLLFREEL